MEVVEMNYMSKGVSETNSFHELQNPGNVTNSVKSINHQVTSRQSSSDEPEKPPYTSPHRVSVFSRGEADNFKENLLQRRRAARLGSIVDDSANEDEPSTPGGILTRYVERASVPGLAYLYTSKTRLARVAWCGMLMVTLGALTLHMFYLVDTYLSWQKHTQVALGFDALQFPAVTFCNVNPARTSRLKLASKELQDLAHKIKPEELAKKMLHQSIADVSSFAKEQLKEEVAGTEYEGVVNEGINFVDNLFRAGQSETDKNRKRNKNNNNNDDDTQETDDNADEGFRKNSTQTSSNNDTSSAASKETKSSVPSETGTEKTKKNDNGDTSGNIGDLFVDIFRGRRSVSSVMRRLKRAFPSLPKSVDLPPVSDIDLEEPIEVPKAQETATDGQVSPSADVTTQSQVKEKQKTSDELTRTDQVSAGDPQPSTVQENPRSVTTDPISANHQSLSGEGKLTPSTQPLTTEHQSQTLNTSNLGTPENSLDTDGADRERNIGHVTTESLGALQGLIDEEKSSATPAGVSNDALTQTSVTTSELFSMRLVNTSKESENTTEDDEEPQPMNFINNLDVVGTNIRSEVERSVFSEARPFFTEPSAMASIREQFTYLFNKENRSTRVAMGHKIKDMLVDCSFHGGRCLPDDFKLFSSPTFGNCYTMDYSNMRVLRSGPANGLSLIVFLENDEYLKGLTSGTGGLIVIHNSDTFAFPDSDGLALAAGMEVHISIRMTRISRLGRPYGDCENGDVFRASFKHDYTRRTCQHFCVHTLITTHCGCYDNEDEEIQLIMQNHSMTVNAERPCETFEDVQCMAEIEKKHLMRELDCNCKNPCLDVTYTKTISSRQWPTDDFAEVLIQTLCESRSEKECKKYKKVDKRLFSLNFLKVNIFYEDLNYENITEQASYELTQFYSDIGGALGLWMGLSVIAVLEVLHFLTSLLRLLTSVIAARVKSLSRLLRRGESSTEPMQT